MITVHFIRNGKELISVDIETALLLMEIFAKKQT